MNALLRIFLVALLGLTANAARADNLGEAVQDLPAEAQAKVRSSATAFLRASTAVDRSANDLGWDCQAALALEAKGVEGARERLAAIAGELLADVVRSKKTNKAIGWATSGGQPQACVVATAANPNVRAECEGQKTLYAFQSGLGLACLAKAGARLQRKDMSQAAIEVMGYWDRLRMHRAPCPECIYFATSDSATEDVRYVRNMSLFLAFGASELAQTNGDKALQGVARKAVQSDIWERGHGNRGYLGQLDPLWTSRAGEADRIENHAASTALLLNVMAANMTEPAVDQQAVTTWRDWATCDNKRCKTEGCKYWAGDATQCQATATAAHCAFRLQEPLARAQCEAYVARVPALSGYALWSMLQAHRR